MLTADNRTYTGPLEEVASDVATAIVKAGRTWQCQIVAGYDEQAGLHFAHVSRLQPPKVEQQPNLQVVEAEVDDSHESEQSPVEAH